MSVARPVRVARSPGAGRERPVRLPVGRAGPAGTPTREVVERRPNAGATRRVVRLSLAFLVGIAAVYGGLFALDWASPFAGSPGSSQGLLLAGVLAAAVAAIGVVLTLGAAPRAVEFSAGVTVVVGRFGRRYRFPGRDRLTTIVRRRLPSGLLSPVSLEVVELSGGSSRRSFLVDEGLFAAPEPAAQPAD
jgi:hypothetical protein